MPSDDRSALRFLVVRLTSFGDVVLSEPVVRQLKLAYPDCEITFATRDQYAALPAMFAAVDRVLAVPRRGRAETPPGGPSFDFAVDLQNNFRSRHLLRQVRPRRVLRYRRQYLLRWLRVHLPRLWRGRLRHTVELYLDALAPLGIEAVARSPQVEVPRRAVADATAALGGRRPVAICPGGSSRHKVWARASFAELAGLLAGAGRPAVILGSEGDRAEVEAVARAAGARALIENDPRVVAALLASSEAVVANDSGLMHLAGAVGSRVIAIFGPTSPDLGFGPLGPGAVVVTRNAACSPCSYHGNRSCRYGRPFCLDDIKAAEVFAVVQSVLAPAG